MNKFCTRKLPSTIYGLSFAILLLPAIHPLFTADFTCGYDHGFHLWRAVEIENLLRHGILFSRWAPDMAHGYGYPLFNFASSASAYGVALLHLLGIPWGWALNLTFAIGWILSAYTMYLFASDLFGRYGGTVAAILYTYAPFHAYDVFYRGGLSQSSAWLFPPLILWALRRAEKRIGFTVTVLGLVGLILTHNAFALLFTPLILAYLLIIAYQKGKKTAIWGCAALVAGLGLSAFFWLPALYDLRFVQSEQLSGAWVFEYSNNFLPLEQLFASHHTADPTMLNDWPARGLGLIPSLFAIAGIFALRNQQHRPQIIFFAIALILCLFLILPISQPIWDTFPLLQRVQFPWRLVGPATLCAAVLAGASTPNSQPNSQSQTRSLLITNLSLLILIITQLGWFYPRHCPPPNNVSINAMIAWEHATDTIGTTAKGEYLPVWVHQIPENTLLNSAYAGGEPIVRLQSENLPEGTQIHHAEYGPTDAIIKLETPSSFQAHYLAFYFPGWRVTIDGNPISIAPTDPDGLIAFDVPADRHTIQIQFGETPLRLSANILSLISLGLTVLIASRIPKTDRSDQTVPPISNHAIHHFLLALTLLFIKLAFLDRIDNPLRRANLADGHLNQVDIPAKITFGDEFILLGYDTLPARVPSGERFEVQTYWQALQPGGPKYGVTINVVDDQGHRWNGTDIRPSRWHPKPPATREWMPNQYALMALSIPLLPGTPPGTYTIEAVAFDKQNLLPLTAHDADGRALGPALPLGQITVTPPPHPINPDTLDIHHPTNAILGPLTLLGINFDRDQAAPGDLIRLTTFWSANERPAQDITVYLTLLAPDGSTTAEFTFPTTVAWHPTSLWKPDDVWRGQHILYLPARLSDGEHTWTLSIGPTYPSINLPSTTHVTAPHHTFSPPQIAIDIDTRLGDITTLLGVNLEPENRELEPGTLLTATLVWRAEAETHTSYNVFLHLLAPDGTLVAQSDGIPANWTRPTTGWLQGEIIVDERILTVPPETKTGEYLLQVGMYTPEDGRLTTPEGTDAVSLPTFTVNDSE